MPGRARQRRQRMDWARPLPLAMAAALVIAGGVLAWRHQATDPGRAASAAAANTAVLGGYGPAASVARPAFPAPPAPPGAAVATIPEGPGALAAWTHDGIVFSARYRPDTGWTDLRPLEEIAGSASDLQIAGNGRGDAMAVWRHTLGSIESLRYSRFDAQTGWSVPDVVAGVLPRPVATGAAPRLQVNAEGETRLVWPSAFPDSAAQTSRFDPARGWSAPEDLAQARLAR